MRTGTSGGEGWLSHNEHSPYPGFFGQSALPGLGFADIFVSMKALSKRQLVRNPSLASHLKPGQSLQLEDGKEPLVVSRRKRPRLTAAQIHAELDRLCEGAPDQDAQAALRDLRE